MTLDWMNMGTGSRPVQKEEGVSLSPDDVFSSHPLSYGAGAVLFREEPLALSAASPCSQPRPSRKGEAVVLGHVWVSAVGGRE